MKLILQPMTYKYLDHRGNEKEAADYALILQPLDGGYSDPNGMVLLDALYDSTDKTIHDALGEGRTITVELSIVDA